MLRDKKYFWQIETSDGKHEIRVKMRSSSREPIDILVDGQTIDTVQYSGGGLVPQMEYDFACGEEKVTLILHGSDFDIVHRGMLVKNNTKYKPQEKLSAMYRAIVLLLTCSAFAVIPLFYEKLIDGTYISFILLAASVAACLLISYAAMMSPFKSKGKKIFVTLLMIAWAWLLAVLIAIFL